MTSLRIAAARNCQWTPTVEFWCMVSAMDVSMNMMAHHVVALERNVAAPRGPKRRLAARAAEGACQVRGLAALQQDDDNQQRRR